MQESSSLSETGSGDIHFQIHHFSFLIQHSIVFAFFYLKISCVHKEQIKIMKIAIILDYFFNV